MQRSEYSNIMSNQAKRFFQADNGQERAPYRYQNNNQGNQGYRNNNYNNGGDRQQTGTPDSLSYNNKRIYLRGYTVQKENIMMSVQPKPAQFLENQNNYTVRKNGYILVEFLPSNSAEKTYDQEGKKTIILTQKNVADILDLDTKSPYNE